MIGNRTRNKAAVGWALLATCGVYMGLFRRRKRDPSNRYESLGRTPDAASQPVSPRSEEPRPQAVVTTQPSLTVHVQEAVYAHLSRNSEQTNPAASGTTVDSSPMVYIHVKATLTPTGKMLLRTIELLSNGQVFMCTHIPESELEKEQTLVLHFEAPAAALGTGLQLGAAPSYIRVTAPNVDVRSNPFILRPAEPKS